MDIYVLLSQNMCQKLMIIPSKKKNYKQREHFWTNNIKKKHVANVKKPYFCKESE